jgi:hypothetical protein
MDRQDTPPFFLNHSENCNPQLSMVSQEALKDIAAGTIGGFSFPSWNAFELSLHTHSCMLLLQDAQELWLVSHSVSDLFTSVDSAVNGVDDCLSLF